MQWMLWDLMRRRRITHATELQRRLREAGADLSRHAVSRMIKTPPERLALRTLRALCVVLECTPADLLVFAPAQSLQQKAPPPPDFMLRKMT
jgi:DNA-binding Xre family transcriptional regulator